MRLDLQLQVEMMMLNKEDPTIFISAAEASGDHHAAGLIRAIKKIIPGAKFIGAAGPKMQKAGCESLIDLTEKASMVLGPLANLRYYKRAIKMLQNKIAEIKPDILIPVDSPALNWHLAKAAKKVQVPVMYYVAPQVWAWAPWRIKKVRRFTDHVACLLPFEQDYFRSRDVRATYVGHPLFDQLPPQPKLEDCPDLAKAWHDKTFTVAMLPGSRPGEIKKHTRALIETARAIEKKYPKTKCIFTAVDQRACDLIKKQAGADADKIEIAVGRTEEILAKAHFAVATSGTVTLEVAHFGVPMVIFYRVNWLAYNLVGRWLLRIKNLSLVNIVAGREIVPELMPWFGSTDQLINTALKTLDDYGYLCTTREKLLEMTAGLVAKPPQTAADNVAQIVYDILRNPPHTCRKCGSCKR